MTTISVLVNGARGRMGQIAVDAIEADPALTCVGQGTRGDDLASMIESTGADVVVDVTVADAVFANTQTIIKAGARPVVGTSGLLPDQISLLNEQAIERGVGGIVIPNFSLGAVLMIRAATEIAAYLPQAEIIEMHHDGKQDAPSGTALRTAECMAANRTQKPDVPITRETVAGGRGATYEDIPIHAVRLPGVLAQQTVIFGNQGETLQIRHESIDRSCFQPGIALACKGVVGIEQGILCGLEHLL